MLASKFLVVMKVMIKRCWGQFLLYILCIYQRSVYHFIYQKPFGISTAIRIQNIDLIVNC